MSKLTDSVLQKTGLDEMRLAKVDRKKEKWMGELESHVVRMGGAKHAGKIDWDTARHLYNQGHAPHEAAENYLNPGKKEEVELTEESALTTRKNLVAHLGKIGYKSDGHESSGGQHKAWMTSKKTSLDHEAVTKHLQSHDPSTKHFAPAYTGDRHTWHGKGWSVEEHGKGGLFASAYRNNEAGKNSKHGLDENKEPIDPITAARRFTQHASDFAFHNNTQGWTNNNSIYNRDWKKERSYHKREMAKYKKLMGEETIVEAFKVGDTVYPLVGPHKTHAHKVIHVHTDGSYNITPSTLRANENRYHLGAARAQAHQLSAEPWSVRASREIKKHVAFQDAAATGNPKHFAKEDLDEGTAAWKLHDAKQGTHIVHMKGEGIKRYSVVAKDEKDARAQVTKALSHSKSIQIAKVEKITEDRDDPMDTSGRQTRAWDDDKRSFKRRELQGELGGERDDAATAKSNRIAFAAWRKAQKAKKESIDEAKREPIGHSVPASVAAAYHAALERSKKSGKPVPAGVAARYHAAMSKVWVKPVSEENVEEAALAPPKFTSQRSLKGLRTKIKNAVSALKPKSQEERIKAAGDKMWADHEKTMKKVDKVWRKWEHTESLEEGKMSEIASDIGDKLDKHIGEYKKNGGAEALASHVTKAHAHIAKLHGLKPEHAKKFVNDYVDSALKESLEEGSLKHKVITTIRKIDPFTKSMIADKAADRKELAAYDTAAAGRAAAPPHHPALTKLSKQYSDEARRHAKQGERFSKLIKKEAYVDPFIKVRADHTAHGPSHEYDLDDEAHALMKKQLAHRDEIYANWHHPEKKARANAEYDKTVTALKTKLGPNAHVGHVDSDLASFFSDMHKDVHGMRPRGHYTWDDAHKFVNTKHKWMDEQSSAEAARRHEKEAEGTAKAGSAVVSKVRAKVSKKPAKWLDNKFGQQWSQN